MRLERTEISRLYTEYSNSERQETLYKCEVIKLHRVRENGINKILFMWNKSQGSPKELYISDKAVTVTINVVSPSYAKGKMM